MLTADVAAIAIVTASRLLGVHPLMVLDGMPTPKADQTGVSRARSYAAVALDQVLNSGGERRVSRSAIARSVGSTVASESSYVAAVRGHLQAGTVKWWKEGDFQQVCAAIAKEIDRAGLVTPEPPPPAAEPPPPTPAPPPARKDAVTAIAALRARQPQRPPPAPPRAAPAPAPAVVTKVAAPLAPPDPTICVSGVTVDPAKGTVEARGTTVQFDRETVMMIAALVRVMPALLGIDRIATKVWGENTPAARYRIPELVERANPALERLRLKIRLQPKIGYSISDA